MAEEKAKGELSEVRGKDLEAQRGTRRGRVARRLFFCVGRCVSGYSVHKRVSCTVPRRAVMVTQAVSHDTPTGHGIKPCKNTLMHLFAPTA